MLISRSLVRGGDSLRSIQVVARTRSRGLTVTTREIFECRTAARLAEVAADRREQIPALEELPGGGVGELALQPVARHVFEHGGGIDRFAMSIVLDLPAWRPDQIEGLDCGRTIYAAYDPLKDDAPTHDALSYVRLPGPAGHRSRYDEASIERIAEHLEKRKTKLAFCVFRNIDMHANALQLERRLAPKKS